MKKLLNRKDKRRSLSERERAVANTIPLLNDHYNENDYSRLRRPSTLGLRTTEKTSEYQRMNTPVSINNTSSSNSNNPNNNDNMQPLKNPSISSVNVSTPKPLNIVNQEMKNNVPGKPVNTLLRSLHVSKSASSLQSSSNSNLINHEQAKSLQSLVDPSWDHQVIKSGWVNKIDENDNNAEPELRFCRAELKGSMLYLYRPPQELQQVKHFEPESNNPIPGNDSSSEFLPLSRMNTADPARSDAFDPTKTLALPGRRPTLPDLADAERSSHLTSQSSFTLGYDQDDNRSLRSKTAISVNLREFPDFDQSSYTMDELSYASATYPHPDLVLDEDIGMILTGTLESICHTILFNPSAKIATKLIKILPLVDHVMKALAYFQKYLETFVELNASTDSLGDTYGTVSISHDSFVQMNDRLVLIFETICSMFPGMLLEEEILKTMWHLLILLDGRKNCDELKIKIHKLQLDLTRLVETDKSDLGHVSMMLSFEGLFSHDLMDVAYEMNAISLKFSNVWDARIDVSLQYQTVQGNYNYWKKNPLVFSPVDNIHYLGRLMCYQLFHDAKFSATPESRAIVLTKWIELGSILADLGDMISWLAIATTICSMPILRLSRTWSYVDPALIKSMSKQWAPVVFELDRRSMVSTSSHRSSSHILVPNGIGEKYAKENAVPFFGDLFVSKIEDDGNLVKDSCKMSDIVKNSLEKWDKYFEKVNNKENLQVHENLHQLSGTFNTDVQKRLRAAFAYHSDLSPLTNENVMEESLIVEKSYSSQFNKYHNTSRSPLFLGSYPSILFPKILASYSIYDQDSLVGALGAVTSAQNLNQSNAFSQGNLIKDSLSSTEHLPLAHRKTGRNQFLRSIRDLFNIDSKEFHFSDSIIFKALEIIEQEIAESGVPSQNHNGRVNHRVSLKSTNSTSARSRPSSVLFSENLNIKRYSSYSTNSFTLEEYVHTYQDYIKDQTSAVPTASKVVRDLKKEDARSGKGSNVQSTGSTSLSKPHSTQPPSDEFASISLSSKQPLNSVPDDSTNDQSIIIDEQVDSLDNNSLSVPRVHTDSHPSSPELSHDHVKVPSISVQDSDKLNQTQFETDDDLTPVNSYQEGNTDSPRKSTESRNGGKIVESEKRDKRESMEESDIISSDADISVKNNEPFVAPVIPLSAVKPNQSMKELSVELLTKCASLDRLLDLLVLTSSLFSSHITEKDLRKFFSGKSVTQDHMKLKMDNGVFTVTFFETYRGFCSTSDLLEGLTKRFLGSTAAAISIDQYTKNGSAEDFDKFPDWNQDVELSPQINWKFVAQVQLGILETLSILVKNYYSHFVDNLKNKTLFDNLLHIIDEETIAHWPQVINVISSTTDQDVEIIKELFERITSIYKQMRKTYVKNCYKPQLRAPGIKFNSDSTIIPADKLLPRYSDLLSIEKFVDSVDDTVKVIMNSIPVNDWIDVFDIIEVQIAKSPISLFNYDVQMLTVPEDVLIISNIYHWISNLVDSGNKPEGYFVNKFPPSVRSIFQFYFKLKNCIMIQLVDESISPEERADRMATLLYMLQVSRLRMKQAKLFDSDSNLSSRVPSLIESCLVHIILAPESRVFSDCWVSAAKLIAPELSNFDDLNEMLPLESDLQERLTINTPLTPCAGWFLQRLLEIACFIPNMSVENTKLINFDKRRFVYNCISNIVAMIPNTYGKDVGKTGFSFLLGFRTQQLDLKSIFKMAREHNEGIRIFKTHIADQLRLLRLEHAKRSLLLKQEAERNKSSRVTLNSFEVASVNTMANNSNPSIKRMPDFIRSTAKQNPTGPTATSNASHHHPQYSHTQSRGSVSNTSSSRFKFPGFFKNNKSFSFNHNGGNQQMPQQIQSEVVRVRKAHELPSGDLFVSTKNNKAILAINLKNYSTFPIYKTPCSFRVELENVSMTGYSFQSLNENDKEDWIHKITFAKKHWYWSKTMNKPKNTGNNVVFGIPIEFVCLREDSAIPIVIERIMTEIEYRGLEEVGIYRKSASLSLLQQIKREIDVLGDFNMENQLVFDVHNLTGCIKLYLRELPEPLIPDDFLDLFSKVKEISQTDEKFEFYHETLAKLPPFNFNLLERLIRHLKLIDEYKEFNKMNASNLATVLGGTFIEGCKPENYRGYFGLMTFICEDMINHYEAIFQKEMEQDE